jgi:hypothetical protein
MKINHLYDFSNKSEVNWLNNIMKNSVFFGRSRLCFESIHSFLKHERDRIVNVI